MRGLTVGLGISPARRSAASVSLPPVPTNTVAPVVSGTALMGYTLSTTDGTWTNTPTSYTYQWTRAGADISGATANTYAVTIADEGEAIRCKVTAINAGGSSTPATSNAVEQWIPTDAATAPQAWARARKTSNLTLTGSSVDSWVIDGSIGGTLSQSTAASKPTYSATGFASRPGITFDGTDDSLDATVSLNYLRLVTGATIAMAARTTTTVGTRRAITVSTASDVVTRMGIRLGGGVIQIIGAGGTDGAAFTSYNVGVPPTTDAVYVGIINHATSTAVGSINGTASTPGAFTSSGATSDTASARRRLGQAINGAADFWSGAIAEYLIFPAALSTSDRQKLEGYLAWANNTVSALDGSHPYKSVAPTP